MTSETESRLSRFLNSTLTQWNGFGSSGEKRRPFARTVMSAVMAGVLALSAVAPMPAMAYVPVSRASTSSSMMSTHMTTMIIIMAASNSSRAHADPSKIATANYDLPSQFAELDATRAINTATLDYIERDGNELTYRMGQEYGSIKLTAQQADAAMQNIAARDGFIKISPSVVAKMAAIASAQYKHGELTLRTLSNRTVSTDMSVAQVGAVLDQLAAKPNMIRIDDSVWSLAGQYKVTVNDDSVRFSNWSDSSYRVDATHNQIVNVQAALKKAPTMLQLEQDVFYNISFAATVTVGKDALSVKYPGDSAHERDASPALISLANAKLAGLTGYTQLGDGVFANRFILDGAELDNGQLTLRYGSSQVTPKLSENNAKAAISGLSRDPRFVSPHPNWLVNKGSIETLRLRGDQMMVSTPKTTFYLDYASQEQAAAQFKQMIDNTRLYRFGHDRAVNLNAATDAAFDPGWSINLFGWKINFFSPEISINRGYSSLVDVNMNAPAAADALKAIDDASDNLVKIGNRPINLRGIQEIRFDGKELELDFGDKSVSYRAGSSDHAQLLEALKRLEQSDAAKLAAEKAAAAKASKSVPQPKLY